MQDLGIKTAVSDPQAHRRLDQLTAADRAALQAAKRTVSSKTGKACLKRRAELLERGFQHVLDSGGARRTTLRGRENIRKRYLIQAACANLSLLMRRLAGVGTPKQALAGARAAVAAISDLLRSLWVLTGADPGRREPLSLRVAPAR